MPESKQPQQNKQEYHLPINELFPDLNAQQLEEAEYFLTQYLEIIYRIYEESGDLTTPDLNTTV